MFAMKVLKDASHIDSNGTGVTRKQPPKQWHLATKIMLNEVKIFIGWLFFLLRIYLNNVRLNC